MSSEVMGTQLCVYRLVLLTLWEHIATYTLSLWGLVCLMGTKCKSPQHESLNFRVKTWIKVWERLGLGQGSAAFTLKRTIFGQIRNLSGDIIICIFSP